MRICFMMAAVFALASAASAEAPDRPTAILVSPIHEAQIVRADDGKDHVDPSPTNGSHLSEKA